MADKIIYFVEHCQEFGETRSQGLASKHQGNSQWREKGRSCLVWDVKIRRQMILTKDGERKSRKQAKLSIGRECF